MPFTLLFLTIAFLAGLFAFRLAVRKARNPYAWMVATVRLLFPVVVLLFLPEKPQQATGVPA